MQFKIHEDVNPKLFHDTFQIVRQYLWSGDAVDLHESYDDCRCFLSSDGLSGFAIEKEDGNLVSVFSLRKGFLPTCGKYMVEQGATKLDCFESKMQNLPEMYKKTLGFSVASKLDFNYDIIAGDEGKEYADYFVETYGEAPVLFLFAGDAPKELEKHFKKDEYGKAVDYRNELIKKYGTHKEKPDIRKSMGGLTSVWILNHCFPNRT